MAGKENTAGLTERLVVDQIRDYLAAKHYFSMRINTGTVIVHGDGIEPKTRVFRAHDLGPGVADILVLPIVPDLRRSPVWIECKSTSGRQTDMQRHFADYVRSFEQRYLLARSIDDLKGIL